MNKEEKIEVMKAYIDGKAIEQKNKDYLDWTTIAPYDGGDWMEQRFNFHSYEYRIKREPREWKLGFDENGTFRDCRIADEPVCRFALNLKYIKVREVAE